MDTKTELRILALEAAVKVSHQFNRDLHSFDVIAEATEYFNWLTKDELEVNISIKSAMLDDEIPF